MIPFCMKIYCHNTKIIVLAIEIVQHRDAYKMGAFGMNFIAMAKPQASKLDNFANMFICVTDEVSKADQRYGYRRSCDQKIKDEW